MLILATSTPKIAARKKASGNIETGKTSKNSENCKNGDEDLRTNLAQVFYIYYPIILQKQFLLALLNSRIEINAIHPTFVKELELSIRSIKIRA